MSKHKLELVSWDGRKKLEYVVTCLECGKSTEVREEVPFTTYSVFDFPMEITLECAECKLKEVPVEASSACLNVLLSEATTEQFIAELMERYPDMLFAGVSACQRDNPGGFEIMQNGSYLIKRGLYAVIGEQLDYETDEAFYDLGDDGEVV